MNFVFDCAKGSLLYRFVFLIASGRGAFSDFSAYIPLYRQLALPGSCVLKFIAFLHYRAVLGFRFCPFAG